MKSRFAVLIPDGESGFSLSVLRCLAQVSGVKTHLLSSDDWTAARFSRHRSQYATAKPGAADAERLAAIGTMVRRTGADVVLPVGLQGIRLLSSHAGMLPSSTVVAPLPERAMFDITASKWALAEWLKRENFPAPATILYRRDAEFTQQLLAVPFPVLLKPTQREGGAGIEYFPDREALSAFLPRATLAEEFILQSYVSGYDIDCSVLCRSGEILAYTIQKSAMAGRRRFSYPTAVDFIVDERVLALVRRMMAALQWSGIAHIDMRYDEQAGQIKVLEINPRFWASLPGSFLAGVNFPYLACLAGLGGDLPPPGYRTQRFVEAKTAVTLLGQRLLRGEGRGVDAATTDIAWTLTDPVPYGVIQSRQALATLKSRLTSLIGGVITD